MAEGWRPSADFAVLKARSAIIQNLRTFLSDRGCVEVATPVLGRHTVTDVHIESLEVAGRGYLQTSPEYFLKRLLAAGSGDLFQLGPVFRAEERGRLHHEEFALLEWYRLGWSEEQLMAEVAELVAHVLGAQPHRFVRFAELVDVELPPDDRDLAFAQACDPLEGRCFVTHYPADQAALARLHADGTTAARFELIVDGIELANGYWESTSAEELRARFVEDNARRQAAGRPPRAIDEDFLAAMSAGLPDCSGVALGVDRLVMLALGAESLAEVVPFA